jgi:hypothetical protein
MGFVQEIKEKLRTITGEIFSIFFIFQQASQCTYNVALRSVGATIVAVGKLYVLNILSVCL